MHVSNAQSQKEKDLPKTIHKDEKKEKKPQSSIDVHKQNTERELKAKNDQMMKELKDLKLQLEAETNKKDKLKAKFDEQTSQYNAVKKQVKVAEQKTSKL